jgi:molybdopterin-guanine dinucleotide biosynthesis protein A
VTREPAGLILAGGAGNRMGGVVKARLRVGGVALLDRAVAALRGTAPILLAHGPLDPAFLARPNLVAVPDGPPPPEGPLAGLAAALDWLEHHGPEAESILSLAVDTPFFPQDFAERALPLFEAGAPAVVGCFCGQDYPTNALWRIAAVRAHRASLPESPARLLARLGAARLDWAVFGTENPFANINTPAELIAANRRARGFSRESGIGNFGLGKAEQSR